MSQWFAAFFFVTVATLNIWLWLGLAPALAWLMAVSTLILYLDYKFTTRKEAP